MHRVYQTCIKWWSFWDMYPPCIVLYRKSSCIRKLDASLIIENVSSHSNEIYIRSVSSCIVLVSSLYHACIRTYGIHDSFEQIHARYITDTSRKKYRIRSHFFRLYPLCINTDTSAMQSGYEPLFSDENH